MKHELSDLIAGTVPDERSMIVMTVSLQDLVLYVVYRERGRVFRLQDIVKEIEKVRSGHIGSAAVNACLDRLVRAGEVVKFEAPNGVSCFQSTNTTA